MGTAPGILTVLSSGSKESPWEPASAFVAIPAALGIPALPWAFTFPLRNRKFLTKAGCSAARKVPLRCLRETWVPVTGHFFPSISEAGLPYGGASLAAGSLGLCRVLLEQGCT